MVVVFDTTTDSKALKHELVELVLRRLPRHHDSVHYYTDEGIKYHYHVVCGTMNTQCRHDDTPTRHSVFVAVHLENLSTSMMPALMPEAGKPYMGVLIDEEFPQELLSADEVLTGLSIQKCAKWWLSRILSSRCMPDDVLDRVMCYLEPDVIQNSVRSVGVNAVSPAYMARVWGEIVCAPHRLSISSFVARMDNGGAGYGSHPMWVLEPLGDLDDPFDVEWIEQRECSSEFKGSEWRQDQSSCYME